MIVTIVCVLSFNAKALAWGPEGHAIVGRLALQFVNADVKKNIRNIHGDMPMDTAANWMDMMKSDADYDFMRPWHKPFLHYFNYCLYSRNFLYFLQASRPPSLLLTLPFAKLAFNFHKTYMNLS